RVGFASRPARPGARLRPLRPGRPRQSLRREPQTAVLRRERRESRCAELARRPPRRGWPERYKAVRCCRSSCLLGILHGIAQRADHQSASVEQFHSLVEVIARLRTAVDEQLRTRERFVPPLLRTRIEATTPLRVLALQHFQRSAVIAGGTVQSLLRLRIHLVALLVRNRRVA